MSTTRYRETDNRSSEIVQVNVYNSSNVNYANWFGPGFTSGEYRTIADNVNSSFRRRQSEGAVILSDLALTKWKRVFDSIDYQYGPYEWWGNGYNVMRGPWIALVEQYGWDSLPRILHDAGNAPGEALIKAYAKINEAKVLSGESLMDVGRTVAMLRRPFRSATKLLTSMVKSRTHRLKSPGVKLAQASSDTWLEYRYAWKPIIMDGMSVIDDVNRKLSRASDRQQRLVARAGVSLKNNCQGTIPPTPLSGELSKIVVSGSANLEQSVRVNAGVVYALAARTTPEAFAAYYGLRARDIPALVWEKIPFSFVADWFVNVGDWLEASLPAPDIRVIGNWVTTVSTSSFSCEAQGSFTEETSYQQHTTFTPNFGRVTVDSTGIRRDCNQLLPELPVMKVGTLSLLHTADAAALSLSPIKAILKTFRH